MTVCYSPSSTDLALFEKYRAKLLDWVKANPGSLVKVGGKATKSNRHQDATHYDRKYFNTDSAYIFPGTLTTAGKQRGSSSS